MKKSFITILALAALLFASCTTVKPEEEEKDPVYVDPMIEMLEHNDVYIPWWFSK